MKKLTLRSKRLLLREYNKLDFEAVHEYASDPEVVKYEAWGPNTEEETCDFIRRATASRSQEPRKDYEVAVVLSEKGRLIGGCAIHITDIANREAGIGYCFNPHFWGQGYATEAATRLLEFGFGQLELHRIFGECNPANIASRRVLEKIGMQREGLLREHKLARGEWHDSLLYSILDHEWERL